MEAKDLELPQKTFECNVYTPTISAISHFTSHGILPEFNLMHSPFFAAKISFFSLKEFFAQFKSNYYFLHNLLHYREFFEIKASKDSFRISELYLHSVERNRDADTVKTI